MRRARFKIMGRCLDGTVIRLFTWARDAETGVARGWRDASMFGFALSDVWAEAV